ncbi:HtaA domain-containing protein [Nocardia cyriacigeorgica]|uniref:HtaA domain-containing protein n=1 Tax=Nocardia cyriacigeorgica TaxID=135487 RepID=UPI0024546B86|nr:HtaA domain-containing protein [Nocardia cyriacigeorgica]
MRTTLLAVVAVAAVTGTGAVVGVAPTATVQPAPAIELFTADGRTPLADTPVHVGDTIVVKGRGFDPEANTSGLPVPVPPGVPHGTFVTFGAFAPQWRPSEGAPTSARAAQRSAVQWVLSRSALDRVPSAPFDFQRTIRHQWVELEPDGEFTAALQVRLPEQIPAGARFGVYTYGAAEAINPAQELAAPVVFDPAPGPNAPAPPPQDLRWALAPNFESTVTDTLQGTLAGSGGAGVHDDGSLGFTFDSAELDAAGYGTLRYRGTVVAATRFHLGEIAIANPWIEFTPEGTWLTAETSTSDTVGADSLARTRLARLETGPAPGATQWTAVPARFEPTLRPASLLPYANTQAAPVSFHIG